MPRMGKQGLLEYKQPDDEHEQLSDEQLFYPAPKSQNSNPHSTIAFHDGGVTSRGFLPRGLSDACPLSTCVRWQACGWGQVSYNP